MRLTNVILATLAHSSLALAARTDDLSTRGSVPSGYVWSFSQWSSGWFGSGWANFYLSAPAATQSGVTIPALSFTARCSILRSSSGTQSGDCTSLIANNSDKSRSVEFSIRAYDSSLKKVQVDATYSFQSSGSDYTVTAFAESDQANTPIAFTVTPSALDKA